MKITEIHAWQPVTPDSPQDWRTQIGQVLVQVTTDQGWHGIGVGGGGEAGIHVIKTVLSDAIVNTTFNSPQEAHAIMCDFTCFYGRKGIVPMAISGVDLAIWDAFGKSTKQSVFDILCNGESRKTECRMYTTVFDELSAQEAIAAGKHAVKLHVERFGSKPVLDEIAHLVANTREVLGPDPELMIDAFGCWDVETTLQIAELIEPYRLAWIEEPLMPDQTAGYQELCRHSPIAIAGGEHEYLAEGFRVLIEQSIHQVIQPDINWCGGLTTLIEIYTMAAAAGVRVCPHRGSEPFSLPAILALDPLPLAESARKWFSVLSPAPKVKQGIVSGNRGYGFGVALGDDAL